jgi:hypothetical protein
MPTPFTIKMTRSFASLSLVKFTFINQKLFSNRSKGVNTELYLEFPTWAISSRSQVYDLSGHFLPVTSIGRCNT